MTVKLLEDTLAVLSLGNSAKITDTPTSRPVARNHNLSKMADGQSAARKTAYHTLSLVCRQAHQAQLHLHLQHRYQEAVVLTLHPALTRSESTGSSIRVSTSHEPAEIEKLTITMETTRQHGETRRVICQNGCKNLQRILWTKVFQLQGRTREFFS